MRVAMSEDTERAAQRAKTLPLDELWTGQKTPCPPIVPRGLVSRKGARELLLRWPDVRQILAEAFERLRANFGPDAEVALKRFDDPASEIEDPALYLIVGTRLDAQEARQAMDRFEDDWWLDNVDRAGDHLHVSVEFR